MYSPDVAPPTSVLHLLKEPSETFVGTDVRVSGDVNSRRSLRLFEYLVSGSVQSLRFSDVSLSPSNAQWGQAWTLEECPGDQRRCQITGSSSILCTPIPKRECLPSGNPQTTGYLLGWTCTISQIHLKVCKGHKWTNHAEHGYIQQKHKVSQRNPCKRSFSSGHRAVDTCRYHIILLQGNKSWRLR